ncbi:TPA: thiol:disulfide oxidoreductase, partial [Escherichia coli]|nr:thiol:disulfide oxidoreductase [Escherichia coli]
DIACWPWVNAWTRQRIDLAMYPAVKNWHERIRSRPATGQALLKAQLGDERSDS